MDVTSRRAMPSCADLSPRFQTASLLLTACLFPESWALGCTIVGGAGCDVGWVLGCEGGGAAACAGGLIDDDDDCTVGCVDGWSDDCVEGCEGGCGG